MELEKVMANLWDTAINSCIQTMLKKGCSRAEISAAIPKMSDMLHDACDAEMDTTIDTIHKGLECGMVKATDKAITASYVVIGISVAKKLINK